MSFLSRKPARPGGRGGDAGRDDEYDDYDGYAHDGYQSEDDGWSPNEYFSPEGIKGRWAGEHPDGRAGGRGGRGGAAPGYDSYADDFNGGGYGSGPGYGPDEFATGVYDLPEGADDDRPDRGRRRRRDREDRGERTGILWMRRDRGEDIWPDDGISDEDYWASVAADRPLDGADAPPGAPPGPRSRPATDSPRPGMDSRPPMGGGDSRFGGEQRGERGGAGRLGPPPGLAGDYKPGNPGALGGPSQPGSGRPGSGPMPARPGTGPQAARPGTGPTPTVGVTSSRPPGRAERDAARACPAGRRVQRVRPARLAAVVPAERPLGGQPRRERPPAGPQRLGQDRADRARQRLGLPRRPAGQPEPGLGPLRADPLLRAARRPHQLRARGLPGDGSLATPRRPAAGGPTTRTDLGRTSDSGRSGQCSLDSGRRQCSPRQRPPGRPLTALVDPGREYQP